jgi:hypothetical protein
MRWLITSIYDNMSENWNLEIFSALNVISTLLSKKKLKHINSENYSVFY